MICCLLLLRCGHVHANRREVNEKEVELLDIEVDTLLVHDFILAIRQQSITNLGIYGKIKEDYKLV
jgi:hypothetical protein